MTLLKIELVCMAVSGFMIIGTALYMFLRVMLDYKLKTLADESDSKNDTKL